LIRLRRGLHSKVISKLVGCSTWYFNHTTNIVAQIFSKVNGKEILTGDELQKRKGSTIRESINEIT